MIPEEAVLALRDAVINTNDFSIIASLRDSLAGDETQGGRAKYLNHRSHVAAAARRALALGLDQSPPLSLLDIGTGAGYFPLACRHLGHRIQTIDCRTGGIYQNLVRHFAIPQIDHAVAPFQALPDCGGRFDVVTAFAIAFSQDQETRAIWGPGEWAFLLDDLRDHVLAPGGLLWLWLNPMFPNGARYDDALREFFLGRGAEVSGQHVVWRP